MPIKSGIHKVRCVLNKADQIDATNLVRVYGALLWNVGKVLQTPEVSRVYVSSFWDKEYTYTDHSALFDKDKKALLDDIRSLPRTALERKINSFVARVRQVRTHVCLVTHIKSKLPFFMQKLGAEQRLHAYIDEHLPSFFDECQRIRSLSPGDMPTLASFRDKLASFEKTTRLPDWDAKEIARLDDVLEKVSAMMADVGGVSSVQLACREATEPVAQPRGFMERLVGKRKRDEASVAP